MIRLMSTLLSRIKLFFVRLLCPRREGEGRVVRVIGSNRLLNDTTNNTDKELDTSIPISKPIIRYVILNLLLFVTSEPYFMAISFPYYLAQQTS